MVWSPMVIGLDPCRDRLGWGLCTLEGRAVACGVESMTPGRGSGGFDARRPRLARDALRSLDLAVMADGGEPVAVCIESPWSGPSPRGVIELAVAVGSVWQAVSRRWPDAEVLWVSPQGWRSLTGVPRPDVGVRGAALRLAVAARVDGSAGGSGWPLSPAWADEVRRPGVDKPHVYLRALRAGFLPCGSQDAADAGLIALAGVRVLAED